VELVRTISARSAIKFIQGLVCHFGVPNSIITNNGSQFTSGLFREYCASIGLKICFASVAKGLKTKSFNSKLEACGKKCLDNIQSVLWSIRTSTAKPTWETPIFLVYGAEAVLDDPQV
jgi:hypothetical protein